MTLPAPNLDTRTFDDLIREARNRIPRFTPEWTNLNASDPGMTLVELHAWMTETILHEMNRVPDLNYVKFLDLLGIVPEPAHPARAELSLTLQKLDQPGDALVVPVPRNAQFSVDDPALQQAVTFESDRSFLALNADFGMVVAPGQPGKLPRQMLTQFAKGKAEWLHAFDPFGAPAQTGRCVYLGLVLRPAVTKDLEKYALDTLPAGPLSLFVEASQIDDPDPTGAPTPAPMPLSCGGDGIAPPRIIWQVYTGLGAPTGFGDSSNDGWTDLAVSLDESAGLTRSGSVTLQLPAKATALAPRALPFAFWDEFGATKAPNDYPELKLALAEMSNPTDLDGKWEDMGVTDATLLNEIAACGTDATAIIGKIDAYLAATPGAEDPNPATLSQDDWIGIDPIFDAPLPMADGKYRPLYWIRAKFAAAGDPGSDRVATLQQIRLNTLRATQAATYREERLGVSNGRPGQMFTLPKSPVLIDPASNAPVLELMVGDDATWERVSDFYRSAPGSKHYQLDPTTDTIRFGDGLRGQIPVANSAVIAVMYRVGGGKIGNVGPGTITKLKGRVAGVKEATNPRAAHDGSDAETLEAVKLRAPHDLRHRDRAVTATDFADLALQTPGVALHRAVALPRRAVQDGIVVPRDGSVTLVVLPASDAQRPVPTEAQLRAICAWLEPRRLLTTELHLIQPAYAEVTALTAEITLHDDADFADVSTAAYDALLTFLHPVKGGKDAKGWDFGAAIYHADVYDWLLSVAGVRRVSGLSLTVAGGVQNKTTDITTLPETALPVLTADKINLVLRYA